MKIRDAPWFYLIFKEEKITIMQCFLLAIKHPKNVTRIIAPSTEHRHLKFNLSLLKMIKNVPKTSKQKSLYKRSGQALTRF